MTLLLYWLTLAVTALVVVALAGFLIGIAWALLGARRNVADLADGLETVAEHTVPLEDRVAAVDGALRQAVEDFAAVDGHLLGVARLFER